MRPLRPTSRRMVDWSQWSRLVLSHIPDLHSIKKRIFSANHGFKSHHIPPTSAQFLANGRMVAMVAGGIISHSRSAFHHKTDHFRKSPVQIMRLFPNSAPISLLLLRLSICVQHYVIRSTMVRNGRPTNNHKQPSSNAVS